MRQINEVKRRSSIAVGLIVAGCVLGTAGSALAHTQLATTSPGHGRTVSKGTSVVKVSFTGPLRSGRITVVGPHGRHWSIGSGGRDPRNIKRVIVPLRRGIVSGRYRATWSIVAADGHHQSGSFLFRVR
ncbi:MAG: copper resistance protein CopC [Solirubrobacterales bacterium]|nr:copper resistance protein CopC [Solirubrobacterales bacterium]